MEKRNSLSACKVASRISVAALAVAFVLVGTASPASAQVVLPTVGFDAAEMVTTVAAAVGPLLGAVLLAALSLAIIAFGGRRIMRYITGRA